MTSGEKWLVGGSVAVLSLFLLFGAGLWLRHGEAIYFNRIIAPLVGCL